MKLKSLPDVHALFERYHQARQDLQAALITARDVLDVALAELQDEPAPTPQVPRAAASRATRKPARQSLRAPQLQTELLTSLGADERRHRTGALAMRLLSTLLHETQPVGSVALVQRAGATSPHEAKQLCHELHRLVRRRLVQVTKNPHHANAGLYTIATAGRAWLQRAIAASPERRLRMPPIAVRKHPLYQPHGMEGTVLNWMQQHKPELPITAPALTTVLRAQFPEVAEATLRKRVNTALYILARRGVTERRGWLVNKASRHGGKLLRHTLSEPKPAKAAKVAKVAA